MNVLFTFRRPVKDPDAPDKVVYQDNYINPLQIISAFWEVRTDRKVLNVFTLTYTFTLNEVTGKVLLAHMENVLRYMVNSGAGAAQAQPAETRERRPRPVMDATAIEDVDIADAPNWGPQN